MPLLAGHRVTIGEVRATIKLLRYYGRFAASHADICVDPENDRRWARFLHKEEARRRHKFLIDAAINRKAGIPDVACRKQDPDYWRALCRDCRRVRDKVNHRVVVRQFETPEIRRRFGQLLTTPEDE